MPLTLTLTEGIVPAGTEARTFAKLSDAMMKWHGLAGHPAMAANIVGAIHLLPRGHGFAGSQPADVVFIEWKVPSFAFATREVQLGYIAEATGIVHEASERRHPKERIWVNVVHAVDGAWGIGGVALTNAELGAFAARG